MKARTFDLDGKVVTVEVKTKPNQNGLVLCELNGKRLVRHKDRLEPLDVECQKALDK